MSGGNVLRFLVSEEVFESYGTEAQLTEIMETGQTETEMVAYMGQFLLMKCMNQNEEIRSLRSILSEQDQEMKYVKKKHEYMGRVDANYKAALQDMEIEKDQLEKVNYACGQELRRLQQKLSRLNDMNTLLRKSILELTESRSVHAIQPDTLKNIPIRNYCLLCLNPKDHSDVHNKLNDDLLHQISSAQKHLANLELGLEAENRKKKILDEKLIALRKEVKAITLYLKWFDRTGENNTSCGAEKIVAVPDIETPEYETRELEFSVVTCDDTVERTEHKMTVCKAEVKGEKLNPIQSYRISNPTILPIADRITSDLVNRAVQRAQKCQTGKSDEELKYDKCIETSEVIQPGCYDSDNNDDVIGLNMQDEQENHPQNEAERQKVETEVHPGYGGKTQVPEMLTGANTLQNCDDLDAHCTFCVVDGQCQACKGMQEQNIGCFRELFKRIIDIIRAILRDK